MINNHPVFPPAARRIWRLNGDG